MAQRRSDWLKELLHLHDKLGRYFDDDAVLYPALRTWAPQVDLYETEDEICLSADMPSVDEKDIGMDIDGTLLTINGQRRARDGVEEEDYIVVERSYGPFQRSFRLPAPVLETEVEAVLRHGVLRVKMKKDKRPHTPHVRITITRIG